MRWTDYLLVVGVGLVALGIGMSYRESQKETKVELIRGNKPTMVLVVPTVAVLGESSLININRAGADELDKLSGVGPVLAGRIIEYRERNGGFRDINEIKLVAGIGEKLFEKIKGYISL